MSDIASAGKKAETKIKEWLNRPKEGFFFYRLPDQLSGFYGSTNPCDFYLYKSPNFYLIESKSTWNDRFEFNAITDNQRKCMIEASKVNGVTSYVAVLFVTSQRMFLLDINDIVALEEAGKKSINIEKIDKWIIPYIEVRTVPSRKVLLDYDPSQANEIF